MNKTLTQLHENWMTRAITYATSTDKLNEPMFGCVIVDSWNNGIGWGRGTGSQSDPTDHSEIQAIRAACRIALVRCPKFLKGCTLYSTHEPCIGCCGFINHAKISRVVWGSYRASLPHLFNQKPFSAEYLLQQTTHPPEVIGGVLNTECIALFEGVHKWD